MGLIQAVLWLHVLCGVAWVGMCASFVLAATALHAEPEELRSFASRTAPRINRILLLMAFVMPLTGIGNLVFAARARRFALPGEFVAILAAKVALFTAMALLLWRAWRAEAVLCANTANSGSRVAMRDEIRALTRLYGFSVAAGALALGLGLWLSGT